MPVLVPLLIRRRHLHLTQIYFPSPGGDITPPYRKRPGEQRGIWWGQESSRGLCGAQVRKVDGAEMPARGSRDGLAFGLFHVVVCAPPGSAGSSGGPCRCSQVCFILLHPVTCGSALFFSLTATRTKTLKLCHQPFISHTSAALEARPGCSGWAGAALPLQLPP